MILLPGRSYGNQDGSWWYQTGELILLPGRSYGNQDTVIGGKNAQGFYYLGDRTVIKTITVEQASQLLFYYLGDRTVIKTNSNE